MKKYILILLLLPLLVFSQKNSQEIAVVKKFQKELNAEYLNPKETPLRGDNFKNFKQHPFFPIDIKYRVSATFTRTENAEPFDLPTSSGKSKKIRSRCLIIDIST